MQLGLRYDISNIQTSPNATFPKSNASRSSNAFSGSIGGLWNIDEHWTSSVTLSRSFRPPTVAELYARGVDAPTNTFDFGDSALVPETGLGLEYSLKGSFSSVSFELTPYINFIDNYIYGYLTGGIDTASGLFDRQLTATNARLIGFEASVDAALTQHIGLLATADYVQSQDTQADQPLPFTPPMKGMIRLSYIGDVSGLIEMRAAADQTRLGVGDTPTGGYAVYNAGISYRISRSSPAQTIGLYADNIFNRQYRDALSVIKDFVPMAGFGVRGTYSVNF